MYLLYSAALALLLALSSPWWLLQMLRAGKYRAGLAERFGRVPRRLARPGDDGAVWVHAVSVGEVLAISGLVEAMRREWPRRRVFISTTTATGQKLARERFGEENVFYFPLDFAFAVRPYVRALRPKLVVLAETEFWPNFLRLARRSGTRVAAVNARISDRSLPGYRRFHRVMRLVLANIDLFLAQGEVDQRRLAEIGADPARVRVGGNLKFDIKAPAASEIVAQIRSEITDAGRVIVAGSTVQGEEGLLLRAFRAVLQRYPSALMVLAPRHPERFDEVASLVEAEHMPLVRRSQWRGEGRLRGGVLLLDTIGELAGVYAVASIAFVGGSLVAHGGHNILEPAQHGAAIAVGPSMENFRDIVGIFQREDAVRIVAPEQIGSELLRLLANENERKELGRHAAQVFASQSGATERTLAALRELLSESAVRGSAREDSARVLHR